MGGPRAMKAPFRKVKSWMPDTVTSVAFFFLHAYTASDLRTFCRTCVHVRKECSLEISVSKANGHWPFHLIKSKLVLSVFNFWLPVWLNVCYFAAQPSHLHLPRYTVWFIIVESLPIPSEGIIAFQFFRSVQSSFSLEFSFPALFGLLCFFPETSSQFSQSLAFIFALSAAELDQQDYSTAELPALPLPQSSGRQPTPEEAQDIQSMVRRMLAFEPAERPNINAVVETFGDFVQRFPISWEREKSVIKPLLPVDVQYRWPSTNLPPNSQAFYFRHNICVTLIFSRLLHNSRTAHLRLSTNSEHIFKCNIYTYFQFSSEFVERPVNDDPQNLTSSIHIIIIMLNSESELSTPCKHDRAISMSQFKCQ